MLQDGISTLAIGHDRIRLPQVTVAEGAAQPAVVAVTHENRPIQWPPTRKRALKGVEEWTRAKKQKESAADSENDDADSEGISDDDL